MISNKYLTDLINGLVAADTTLWGSIAPNATVYLVNQNFVPNPDIINTDLPGATFTGSAPILLPLGPMVEIVDNLSGRVGILLKEPVGGFKWVCTADPVVPEVIYGWALAETGTTNIYACDLLPVPITINEAGNFVEVTAILGYMGLITYGNLPAV